MRSSIVILASLLLLAGCDYDFPKVDSGVVRQMEGDKSEARELTFLQVSKFADWCAKHRDGWTNEYSDVAPGMLVTFRQKGRDVVTANFVRAKIVVGGKSRSLTEAEAKMLEDILGSKNG